MNHLPPAESLDQRHFSHALPHLSIVIPAYNESERIARCLEDLIAWTSSREDSIEIIVVDDGSGDNTVEIADRFASSHSTIRVLQAPHLGKANAVLAGLEASKGSFAGFCDVDLATPLTTWDDCRRAFQQGAAVAIASRQGLGANRIGEPWYRHAMGRAFNRLVQLLLLPGIQDTQCGFKFFSRDALTIILPRCRLYRDAEVVSRPRVTAFDVELLHIARRQGLEIAVIPVTWTHGEHTKVNPLTDTLQNLRDVLQVRWNDWRGSYD
ncbi:glycosyltransferase family 2 protein [soil metagenome]